MKHTSRLRILNVLLMTAMLIGTAVSPASARTMRGSESPVAPSVASLSNANNRILMFVAYNDVWWTGYKVAYQAFLALGYQVDVVSSATGEAYSYGGNVDASLSTTWEQFTSLFSTNFGVAGNAAWTAQQTIPLTGRVQDVADLSQYDALVIPGGRGAVAYQYDGSYDCRHLVGPMRLKRRNSWHAWTRFLVFFWQIFRHLVMKPTRN